MKFVCPKCLKIAEVEPRSPEHEIVSVYCLHRSFQPLTCSEAVQMEAVLEPQPEARRMPASVGAGLPT
jgi:hypothetical protein